MTSLVILPAAQEPSLKCKAKLLVADPTDSASLFVHDEKMLRSVLRFSDAEWDVIAGEVRRSGEMTHSSKSRKTLSGKRSASTGREHDWTLNAASTALSIICDSATRTRLFTIRCKCRLFHNDVSDEIKLFAIKVS